MINPYYSVCLHVAKTKIMKIRLKFFFYSIGTGSLIILINPNVQEDWKVALKEVQPSAKREGFATGKLWFFSATIESIKIFFSK